MTCACGHLEMRHLRGVGWAPFPVVAKRALVRVGFRKLLPQMAKSSHLTTTFGRTRQTECDFPLSLSQVKSPYAALLWAESYSKAKRDSHVQQRGSTVSGTAVLVLSFRQFASPSWSSRHCRQADFPLHLGQPQVCHPSTSPLAREMRDKERRVPKVA